MKITGILVSCMLAACIKPTSDSCGVLSPGSSLFAEDSLYSCNGDFELRMQGDGNLVLYHGDRIPANAWWATGTNGWDGYRADMQDDGNFVLYDSYGTQPYNALWSSDTWGLDGAQLELGNGGTLAVTYNGQVVWLSVPGDRDASGID